MNHFVGIRSYNLKPNTRDEFHRLFLEEAIPLLQRWNVEVADTVHPCTMKILII